MWVFKFEQDQNSRGWNYRQLRFNLKGRKKRQAVTKVSKKGKNNLAGYKSEDDIRKIVEMYFKDKSLEEAINSVKSNSKDVMNKLIFIKNNWDNLKISKGDK